MHNGNVSDIIENYLKRILTSEHRISINRSRVANLFNVVPSQINYVIKTRFTIANGYLVESKRGDGGYIRIKQIKLLDNLKTLDVLIRSIGSRLSLRDGKSLVNTLYQARFLNRQAANLILAIIDKPILGLKNLGLEDVVRARIMISVLNHLKFKS